MKIYKKIKEEYIKNYERFLPRIYDKEAIKIILDEVIYDIPIYLIDKKAFVIFENLKNNKIFVSKVLRFAKKEDIKLVYKSFYFITDFCIRRKKDFIFTYYDSINTFYEKTMNSVEEKFELSITVKDLVYSLKYKKDDFIPVEIFSIDPFMAFTNINLIKESPLD